MSWCSSSRYCARIDLRAKGEAPTAPTGGDYEDDIKL